MACIIRLIIYTFPYREVMEMTGRHSKSYDVSTKIGCLIDMALKNEISWKMLESLLDQVTSTLEKSKEVIKILLKELRSLQSPYQPQIDSSNLNEFDSNIPCFIIGKGQDTEKN